MNLNNNKIDLDFKYELFEPNYISNEIIKNAGWLLGLKEAYFINGLIRKYKPKNCLEIGVASGGSSILILNAINDIKDANLISLDLNKKLYYKRSKKTGYRVMQYFPKLMKKWKLYVGKQPHEFLVKFNTKFDFLFLDTAHITPGEIINFIEVLPFLTENAIVVIHDILWHFSAKLSIKFYPSNLILFSSIHGDKIILKDSNGKFKNIGAIFLHSNQEKYYLDYFLLLFNLWEYIPNDNQIKKIRQFIKKYYENEIYINNFDSALNNNKKFFKRLIKGKSDEKNYRYVASKNRIIKINK